MKVILPILLAINIAYAIADTGEYVPRAFYTINGEGNTSPLFLLNAAHQQALLHRLKRSPQVYSSSSSSTSSSGGAPGVFSHQSTTYTNNNGYGTGGYVSTSGVVDPYGQVYYNTQTGHL